MIKWKLFGTKQKSGTIMIKLGKNANKVQAIHFDENRILNNCILDPKITEFHIEHGYLSMRCMLK